MNTNKPIVSSVEWWLVIAALALIDAIQILLDFLAIGLVFNRFLDLFVGPAFGLYLVLRNQIDGKMFFGLVVTFIGEEIPGLDVLPFWCLDGYYSMKRARAREQLQKQGQTEESQNKVMQMKLRNQNRSAVYEEEEDKKAA